ncbi:hypothetical protein HZS_6407 [Henneguya salminicola]|nr:hypothetical protein HZS_6407 [Henneguya salminicola]
MANKIEPNIWNASSKDERDIVNRTNNSLERYNRQLNEHLLMPIRILHVSLKSQILYRTMYTSMPKSRNSI